MAKLDYYQDLADDLYDAPNNEDKRSDWEAIDKVKNVKVDVPASVAERYPGIKAASSVPRDIADGDVTFLSARLPIIKVVPMRHDSYAKEQAEIQETVYDWHYALANMRGPRPFQMEITEDAVYYSRIAFRTEYIPWEAKRRKGKGKLYSSEQIKDLRLHGDFRLIRYNPRCVYEEWGASNLKTVLETSVVSYRDLINEYGETPPIMAAIKKEFGEKDPAVSELRSHYVSKRDMYDTEKRVILFTNNGTNTAFQTGGDKAYELVFADHKLPFIPWVVEDFENPLMLGLIRSGEYDRNATLRVIALGEWIRIAQRTENITTPNPKNPDIEYDDEGNRIMGMNTSVEPAPTMAVDQGWMVLSNQSESAMRGTMKGDALINVQSMMGGKNPYSSINAAQNSTIAQLAPIISLVERGLSKGIHQFCKWIAHSGEPLIGNRRNEKSAAYENKMQGARMMVAPFKDQNHEELTLGLKNGVAYVDPSVSLVTVKLQPDTIQDEQAGWNLAIIKQQAGATQAYALESLVPEPEEMQKDKIAEQFVMTDVARMIKDKDAMSEAQIKIMQMMVQAQAQIDAMMQQAQQQMQPPAQQGGPPQQPGLPPSQQTQTQQMNGGAQFAAMKGQTPRSGGPTASQMAPRETRTTLNGTSDGGEEMA